MKLLYVDVETTGLDPVLNGIIQISGIVEIDGDVKEEFDFKCRPFEGDIIDYSALAINKMKINEVRELADPKEVYGYLVSLFGRYVDKYDRSDKFYAVGQNVGFDLDFLKAWFVKMGDKYFGSYIHYHKVDLIAITTVMRIAGKISLDNMKLETLMRVLNFGDQTHDALDDVRACRKIFYYYVSLIKGSCS